MLRQKCHTEVHTHVKVVIMLCLIGVYISSIASNSLSVYYLPLFSLLHSGLLGSSVCFLYTNHFQSVSECAPSDVPSLIQQVAFSAALTNSDETLGPSERDVTLIFKHVVTNIGNAYNPHTGFFTAPVRGAYHFEWHIGDIGGRSPATAAALVKNSERVFSAYANLTPSHFETSSETVLLPNGLQDAPASYLHSSQSESYTFSALVFSQEILIT
uniref:C1q domain-containing protein n=1 Tax=Monopterus albus TaxID=43700 RepID=A0A3Q3KNT9_MONAL